MTARGVVAFAALLLVACRQDMHDQPKYKPLRSSEIFGDKRSARPLVEGTVARGTLREDAGYYAGKTKDGFVTELPVPVTGQLLERGQTQFQVFCAPCHGRTGRGDGMIVKRGFKQPSSYHVDRLRQMPRAVRNGSRVVCVTATRGEGGSMDEERWPPETMGAVRTAELERSLGPAASAPEHQP